MKVEVWSDFVCPFCYIGKRRFEMGLSQFEHQDKVEVVYRSFELDPNIAVDDNPPVHRMLASKYGMSEEQALDNLQQVTDQAATVGLQYHLDRAINTNTFAAHRLTHFAREHGKQEALTERLLKAYFTDGLHIGQYETLTNLAVEVGLPGEDAARVLEDGAFADNVRADEQDAARLGIQGVPFFVFNGKYGVSGAQPSETFLSALQTVWRESV